MDGNVKIQRKSLSLSKRINMRQQGENFCADDDNNPQGEGQDSPIPFLDVQASPPHSRFSLDESIEYSPMYNLNNSFSPSIMSTQALVASNSEVGWLWDNEEKNHEITNYKPRTIETKDIDKFSFKKREERFKELEYKMRQAENNRAAELLRKRCEKFEKQLKEGNALNIQPKKLFDEKSNATSARMISIQDETSHTKIPNKECVEDTKMTKTVSTIEQHPEFAADDDFFNDSAMDDLLLVATQQVEEEINLTQQTRNTVSNAKNSSSISENTNKEKRSSMYMKFLEDDCADDLFGNFDDIIAQAMENSKPKSSFQRYNSMPVESMSPTSNVANKPQKPKNISKPLANCGQVQDHNAIKRHASTADIQVYAPPKMKQIRRI